jgi:hypothetical protein
MHVILAGASHQRWRTPPPADSGGDVGQNRAHALRIGTRSFRGFLRAAQLRRGDHLHRLGDLLRRLHRGDAVAEVFGRSIRQP